MTPISAYIELFIIGGKSGGNSGGKCPNTVWNSENLWESCRCRCVSGRPKCKVQR